MHWLRKKRVWIPLALVALYILFGFLAAGPIVRAQIEQSVLTANAVSDEQLEVLRRERALWVQSALTADGSVSSERVFITADPDASRSNQPVVTVDLK